MTTTTPTTIETTARAAEDFAERVFSAVLGAQEVQAIYLGYRLGWYDALARHGAQTSVELATTTDSAERYAREWLEQQAVCGYLTVDDASATAQERRYSLPPGHAEVLTDEDSLAFVAPLARFVASAGHHLDAIADAYRSGGGVSWSTFGTEMREAQAAANRPLFLHELGQRILPQISDLDVRLRQGARVADVGTGGGWSAIGIALAYPQTWVDGFDVDAPSIELARHNAEQHGVGDRVEFIVQDSAQNDQPQTTYDAVFAFECIHDLPDPVSVLSSMKDMAGPDGIVIVMDENVADAFHAPGDEVERLMFGYSITCCLLDCKAHDPSAETGTVMRHDTLRAYATEAGFSRVDALPIENDFFRFYRLEQ